MIEPASDSPPLLAGSSALGEEDPAMLGVDEARQRILADFSPLPAIRVDLLDAFGMVLDADVYASGPVPPFANSAMDGYAVRAADTALARPEAPVRLLVVGEAAAGRVPSAAVGAGTAVRIMTGAPIPAGADAVVRFEATDEDDRLGHDGYIGIRAAARPGEHVRPAGEDVLAGALVLPARTRLGAFALGVLASIGRAAVTVHRRPRVAILVTGDELAEPGRPLRPGQIYNSNGPTIAALVRRYGGDPVLLGSARDTEEDLRSRLGAVADADLVVTTGGVSVGDYDLVKHVLRAAGRIDLWQVRMRPGKPLAFGWIDGRPLVGLPGNPVAAAVACELFVRPAVLRMLGRTDLDPPTVPARLEERLENPGGRRQFARVRLNPDAAGGLRARLAGAQGAGLLSTLAHADGLLVVPEDLPVAEAGTTLPVVLLDHDR